jgi:predicted GNAT superfamily acetyltransferase
LRSAVEVAQRAAERSGVDVRLIGSLAEIHAVYSLFDRIWQPDKSNPPVTIDKLRAMTHAGNYLAGAFDRGSLVGACVGFFAAPPGVSMHSHVAGVAADVRGRSVGFALKLHQRAWALGQGLTEVTWTFDPLVRRNAYFNLVKLGAIPRDYLVDFYGDMDDGINIGQGSDRLLVDWDLASDAVVDACAGRAAGADHSMTSAAAPFALREDKLGEPQIANGPGTKDVPIIRVQTRPMSRTFAR